MSDKKKICGLLIAIMTPVVGCLLLLLSQGIAPWDFSLTTTNWNDEPMYYKQVEGMVHFGIPQGFFGYNESHSVYGNFGGWTPANLIPYYLVGKIFGWHFGTPVIFNLCLWILVFGFFVIALKPTMNQLILISLSYIAYLSASRYIFSTTPEAFISVSVVLFAISFIKFFEKDSKLVWLVICDIMMLWLTLLRGFYGIFGVLILVAMYLKADKKIEWKKWLIQILLMLVALVGFILLAKYFEAPYMAGGDISGNALFNIKALIKSGILGVIEALKYMLEALKLQSMRGCWYIGYIAIMLWTLVKGIKNKNAMFIAVAAALLIVLASMFVLYNAKEGSRQLMSLTIAALMLLPLYEDKKKVGITFIILIALLFWLDGDSFFKQLSVDANGERETLYLNAQKELSELMPIADDEWDNTVIYSRTVNHQDMMALPAGMGINFCLNEYIKDNFDELSSKYVAVRLDDEIESFLQKNSCEKIYSFNDTVIYKLR